MKSICEADFTFRLGVPFSDAYASAPVVSTVIRTDRRHSRCTHALRHDVVLRLLGRPWDLQ